MSHEETARLRKAISYASFLERTFPTLIEMAAEEEFISLASMPADWWADVAKHAKLNPPSAATIAEIISILSQRHCAPKMSASEFIASLSSRSGREFFSSCAAVQA